MTLHSLKDSMTTRSTLSRISKATQCLPQSGNKRCILWLAQWMTSSHYYTYFASAWMNSIYHGYKTTCACQTQRTSSRVDCKSRTDTTSICTNACLSPLPKLSNMCIVSMIRTTCLWLSFSEQTDLSMCPPTGHLQREMK